MFINKYKYVNFVYGDNRNRIMTSEAFEALGRNMQVEATNTAGKSISIITLLQAVVPLVDTDKNAVDVFTSKEPVYMLIEWVSEDNTRVLTGIGIERKMQNFSEDDKRQDKSKLFEIVTFVVEYDRPNKFDIDNIEITYEKEEKLFCKSLSEVSAMFDRNLEKPSGVKFMKLYKKSYLKDYKEKLEEYGIFPDEWSSIIARLNNGESVLSRYYEENNTTEKLMKNLIVPTIEENIETSKGNSFIRDIQDSLKKYREFSKEHRNEIEEYDNLSRTKEKLQGVINAAESRIKLEESENASKIKFGELYNSVEDSSKTVSILIDEKQREKEDLEAKELAVKLNRDSKEYFHLEAEAKKLKSDIDFLSDELELTESLIDENTRMVALCNLKEWTDRRNRIVSEISKLLAEKDKKEKTQSELMQKLNNLGYSLKAYYDSEINETQKKVEENKNEDARLSGEESSLKDEIKGLSQETKQVAAEQGELKEFLRSYEAKEAEIINKYSDASDYITNTLEGKIFNMGKLIKASEDSAEILKEDLSKIKDEINQYEKELKDSDRKMFELDTDIKYKNEAITRQDEELEKFMEAKEYITEESAKFLLDSSNIFSREIFAREISEAIALKKEKTDTLKESEKKVAKELEFLQGDSNFQLPDALREEFDNLGIPVINGLDWLNKQGLSDEEKVKIYNENPMLVYSLMVTRKELELIKGISFKINSCSPVPLMLREDISEGGPWELIGSVVESASGRFILFYDSSMLDERLLLKRIEALKEQQSKLNLSISKINEDIESLYSLKNKAENFNHDPLYEQKIRSSISLLYKNIEDIVSSRNEIERKIPEIKARIKEKEKSLSEHESCITSEKDKIDKLHEFNYNYCRVYGENFQKQKALSRKEKEISQALVSNQDNLDSIGKQREGIIENRAKLSERLTRFRNESAQYSSYKDGELMREEPAMLISTFKELSSSSEANNLNKINESLSREEKEKTEADNKIKGYERTARTSNFDLIIKSIEEYENTLNELNGEKLKIFGRKQEKTGACSEKEKKLSADYNKILSAYGVTPLPPEEIIDINYKEEMLKIERAKKKNGSELKDMADISRKLEAYSEQLIDYKGITDNVESMNVEKIKQVYDSIKERKLSLDLEIKECTDNLMRAQSELAPHLSGERINVYETIVGMTDINIKMGFLESVLIATDGELDRLISRKLEMEGEKEYIYNIIKDYVDEVVKGIRRLNDIARINRERLMKITLKDENIDYSEIKNIIESVSSNDNLNISSLVTTYYLLDVVAKMKRIQVEIMKYELYSSTMKNWDSLKASSTGAQKFCISFILLAVLLEYKRFDERYPERASLGKVLVMDNPFGEISENTLLKPVFELAEKLKVQIISYTHIQNQAIRDRFDKIYLLKVNKTVSGREIVRLETYKDTITERASANPFFSEQVSFDSI
jgi:chromosome segregation ATPase